MVQSKLNANLSFGEQEISSRSWDEIKDYVMFKDVKVQGAPSNKADVLNLKRIKELVDNDYIPINNKSLTEWVQVGKSDGYFSSDWIVTLTEARKNGTTTDPTDPIIPDIPVDPDASEVMVVAEDLSTYISSDGKELADFDFNDVVFEVSKGNNSMVHIKLLAAGGTLPLTVGGNKKAETELDQGWQWKCSNTRYTDGLRFLRAQWLTPTPRQMVQPEIRLSSTLIILKVSAHQIIFTRLPMQSPFVCTERI